MFLCTVQPNNPLVVISTVSFLHNKSKIKTSYFGSVTKLLTSDETAELIGERDKYQFTSEEAWDESLQINIHRGRAASRCLQRHYCEMFKLVTQKNTSPADTTLLHISKTKVKAFRVLQKQNKNKMELEWVRVRDRCLRKQHL